MCVTIVTRPSSRFKRIHTSRTFEWTLPFMSDRPGVNCALSWTNCTRTMCSLLTWWSKIYTNSFDDGATFVKLATPINERISINFDFYVCAPLPYTFWTFNYHFGPLGVLPYITLISCLLIFSLHLAFIDVHFVFSTLSLCLFYLSTKTFSLYSSWLLEASWSPSCCC